VVSEVAIHEVEEADPDHEYLITTAKQQYEQEGEIEVDANTVVSASEEGAYVQAWVWVDRPKKKHQSKRTAAP